MNICKTNRRIKRRNMDGRAKYSEILTRLGFDGVRRTERVLNYPAARRENTKTQKAVKDSDDFPENKVKGE